MDPFFCSSGAVHFQGVKKNLHQIWGLLCNAVIIIVAV